jgi:hypothetical protein
MGLADDALRAARTLDAFTRRPAAQPADAAAPDSDSAYRAKAFYESLAEWIKEFEATLDADHEVGVRLVSFGDAVTFHLTDMSYWNPQLIRFDGVDASARPVQLIQHVSQISVFLTALPKRGVSASRLSFRAPPEPAR